MIRRYTEFLRKKYRVTCLFFAAVYAAAAAISYSTELGTSDEAVSALSVAAVLSLAFAFVMPIILFAFVQRKDSVDVFCSLPFSRKTQLISNVLFAFGYSFGCYLIVWLVMLIPAHGAGVAASGLVEALAATALMCLTIIVFNGAVFLFANNIVDGIMIVALYHLLPVAVNLAGQSFLDNMANSADRAPKLWSYLSPMASAISVAGGWDIGNENGVFYIEPSDIIVMLVFALIAAFFLKRNFIDRSMERAGSLSDDRLAYPFLIPAFATILMASQMMERSSDLYVLAMVLIVIFVAFMTGSFIFTRSMRPSARSVAEFAVCVAVALALTVVSWTTKGFGLGAADAIDPAGGDTVVYTYSASGTVENLGSPSKDGDDSWYSASTEFMLEVPSDEVKSSDDVKALEDLRRRQIGEYYSRFSYDGASAGTLKVSVYKGGRCVQDHSYSLMDQTLTEAQLKRIAKDTDVEVEVFSDHWNGKITLEKFLKERNRRIRNKEKL